MSDFERYGDYNEVDESPTKSPVGIFIKMVALTLCVGVIGLLAFRIIIFNTYPSSVKDVFFNDTLTEHYEDTDGNVKIYTQSLRANYDDAEEGNFFCDNLYVIPAIGQLQMSLRYNESLMESIRSEYGVEISPDDTSVFTFRLWTSGESGAAEDHITGTLSAAVWDSSFMYRYVKLVFDDVRLDWDSEQPTEWIRLEVFIKGVDRETPYMIAVYENNDDYSRFEEYTLKSSEVPND